ncbi:unnamed protein product [Discosporangium mesarthrocarpum]
MAQVGSESFSFVPRTVVSYTITGGIAYGPVFPLLDVTIYGRGTEPAPEEPKPVAGEGGDHVDALEGDATDGYLHIEALERVGSILGLHQPGSDGKEEEDTGAMEKGEGEARLPRQSLSGTLTGPDLLWWLLMFPFFENEWDVVGAAVSAILDDEGSDGSGCEEASRSGSEESESEGGISKIAG